MVVYVLSTVYSKVYLYTCKLRNVVDFKIIIVKSRDLSQHSNQVGTFLKKVFENS